MFICIKMDLVLNNPQRLICHKTQITYQQAQEYTNVSQMIKYPQMNKQCMKRGLKVLLEFFECS